MSNYFYRFRKENKQQIKPYSFLPFGAGPRSCIGSRFAMLETKIAMVRVLRQFSFLPCDASKDIELECRGAIVPKNGINVLVESRDRSRKISRYSWMDIIHRYLQRPRFFVWDNPWHHTRICRSSPKIAAKSWIKSKESKS